MSTYDSVVDVDREARHDAARSGDSDYRVDPRDLDGPTAADLDRLSGMDPFAWMTASDERKPVPL